MNEKWYLQTKKADFKGIGEKFNINPIIARIIRNRDIVGEENIEAYLHSDLEKISSPWLFKDMDKAVDILKIKISGNNKIRIICDYDVDGVCSGYILLTLLENLGANVDVVAPHRIKDGYGINERLIDKAHEDGIDTIITCDNGIAAYEQIAHARNLGMTVIVTDHHEVPFEMEDGQKKYIVPNADAVVNQKQQDCDYPFKELCGAMVVYQVMMALYETMNVSLNQVRRFLSYAAIATVCDVVDLVGENRIVVRQGLELLKKTKDIGINALIDACKIKKSQLDSYHLGFIIGPCLNASGRLDSAKKAMDLLHCKEEEEAKRLAEELREFNEERKTMTDRGANQAIAIAQNCTDKVLVIYLKDCHESVAGIIAGRVREKYNKPVFILTDAQDELKGSGRSIEEYNMYEELTKVKHLLTKYGGHKMAAGVSLEAVNIDLFRKLLNENCNLTEEDLYLKVWIDMQLPIEYVTMNLMEELEVIKPWGKGNEKPVFAEKNLKIKKLEILGKTGNAIRLTVENASYYRMTAMIFGRTQEFMGFLSEKFGQQEINNAMEGIDNSIVFMATYYPKINDFRGNIQVQMIIDRFC